MRCTKQMFHNEGKIIGALESDNEKRDEGERMGYLLMNAEARIVKVR